MPLEIFMALKSVQVEEWRRDGSGAVLSLSPTKYEYNDHEQKYRLPAEVFCRMHL
jgi:hypothetical protein